MSGPMAISPPLPRITAEQSDLLGLGPAPAGAQAAEQDPGPGSGQDPNQLCLTCAQQVLSAREPPLRQLALLDDPPVWETGPEPRPAARRRPSKRRARRLLSPGQIPLF